MTEEEKMAMYMKCTKKELASMLISANSNLENLVKPMVVTPNKHCAVYLSDGTTGMNCAYCSRPQWEH